MPSALGGQAAISFLPAGSMVDFAGTTAPSGWLMCDGAAVSRTVYASLFSALGTAYGSGDGSTTFNLPDYRGRFARYLDDMGTVQNPAFIDATTKTAGAFVVGRKYKIVTVGTTSFTSIGASSNTIGVVFTATGVGSGTGTALESYRLHGTAQADAMQGHKHSVNESAHSHPRAASAGPGGSQVPNEQTVAVQYGAGRIPDQAVTTGLTVQNPSTDGSNGNPRTGEETRPVNLASYRIIKY